MFDSGAVLKEMVSARLRAESKVFFLLTGYCHGCNMFENCEMQYISIMGKRGLSVYFIASNSGLCVCVCACVSADSGFLASLIRLVADENRSDERYIQYTLSHFAGLFGSHSLTAIRIRLTVASPSLSLSLSLPPPLAHLFPSSNFILLLKHHWSLRAIDHPLPRPCSLLSSVLSKHREQQEGWQWINQFKEWNVCFCCHCLGRTISPEPFSILCFNLYFFVRYTSKPRLRICRPVLLFPETWQARRKVGTSGETYEGNGVNNYGNSENEWKF